MIKNFKFQIKNYSGFDFLISKRLRFLLISFLLTVAAFLAGFFSLSWQVALPLFLLLAIAGVTWALDFDLIFPEHLLFSFLPFFTLSLYYFSQNGRLFGFSSFSNLTLVFLVLVALLIYVEFLTLNIINVATVKTIPLKRAAISVYFLIGLLQSFWGTILLLNSNLSLVDVSFFFFVFFFLLSLAQNFGSEVVFAAQLFNRRILGRPRLRLPENLALSSLMLELFIALSFLKVGLLAKSLSLSVASFMTLSLFENQQRKTLTTNILREHLLILTIILTVFLFVAGQR